MSHTNLSTFNIIKFYGSVLLKIYVRVHEEGIM